MQIVKNNSGQGGQNLVTCAKDSTTSRTVLIWPDCGRTWEVLAVQDRETRSLGHSTHNYWTQGFSAADFDEAEINRVNKNGTKAQKGTTPGHTSGGQGVHQGANKSRETYQGTKEKVLHAPKTVPLTSMQSENGVSRRFVADHETRQA